MSANELEKQHPLNDDGLPICIGDIWKFVKDDTPSRWEGVHFMVIAENNSMESPASWVMESINTHKKTLYMHRSERCKGHWIFVRRAVTTHGPTCWDVLDQEPTF